MRALWISPRPSPGSRITPAERLGAKALFPRFSSGRLARSASAALSSIPLAGLLCLLIVGAADGQQTSTINTVVTAERLISEAQELWNQGDIDKAVETAGKALAIDKEYDHAQQILSTFTDDKASIEDHLAEAKSLADQKQFDEAQERLDYARRLCPKNPAYLQLQAGISDTREEVEGLELSLAEARRCATDGDIDKALRIYDKVISVAPGQTTAWDEREALFAQKEDIHTQLLKAADH